MRSRSRLMIAWLAVVTGVATGCAVELDETIGVQQEEISGGTVATAGWFEPVVDWGGCTATKIGARRFLTAAHCFTGSNWGHGTPFLLTNALDGLEDGPSIQVTVDEIHIHPSFEVAPLPAQPPSAETARDRAYDVALLDIVEPTAGIPVMALSPDYFGDGTPLFHAAGYGCDMVTEADGGHKQYAEFFVAYRSYWKDSLGYSDDWEDGAFVHNIPGWTDDTDDTCAGDSGGPYMLWRNSRWEIIGVHGSAWTGGGLGPFISGARMSNVYGWVTNPGKNDFTNNSGGFLMNAKSGKCAAVDGGSVEPGADIFQLFCDGRNRSTDDQFWRLVDRGNGWFALRNGKSGLCLSSRSPGFGDGVVQYACTASDQYQRWKFEDNSQPDGPEVVRLRNAFWSSKCLGVGGGSTANEALLGVWDCSGTGPGANQSWVFTR